MRLFSLCLALVLPLSAYLASIDIQSYEPFVQEEIFDFSNLPLTKGAFDVLLALLPFYGWMKVATFIKPASLEKFHGFFLKYPNHFDNFQAELAKEGVHLPPVQSMDLTVIRNPSDYDLLKSIIGLDTNIKKFITPEYIDDRVAFIKANDWLIDLGLSRVAELGIRLDDEIDEDAVLATLIRVATTAVVDFVPTALSIVGKRDLTDLISQMEPQEFLNKFKEIAVGIMEVQPIRDYVDFVQKLIDSKVEVDWMEIISSGIQLLPQILPEIINSILNGKRALVIPQITPQEIVNMLQQLSSQFQSNAQLQTIIELIQQLSLARVDIDWTQVATTVIQVLPTLISLLG